MFRWLMIPLLAMTGFLASPGAAGAQERILVDWENPPLMYADNDEARGFYPAIVRDAFARIGVPVEIRAEPWRRVMDEALRGEAGVAGLIRTPERSQGMDFTIPIHDEQIVEYVRVGEEELCGLGKKLEGKTIAAIQGWAYGPAFDQIVQAGRARVLRSRSEAANLELLRIGRVDAFLATRDSIFSVVAESGHAADVHECPEVISHNDVYIAFSKKMNRLELIQKLNAAIREMYEDGTMDLLHRQHGMVQ